MVHLTDKQEIYDLYVKSTEEARIWKENFSEYERLADNGLLDGLDPTLPEVNDGTLAASLFKLPKRIVNTELTGRAKALDRDDRWMTELANLQWENEIVPNANSQAPYHRKWKDAVRKSAIYGSVPIITLFVENGNYTGADFIVAQAQDVVLEAGKVSDYDSDIIFWNVFFSETQMSNMIERAEREKKEAKEEGADGYNKWDVAALRKIQEAKRLQTRDSVDEHESKSGKALDSPGYKFFIAFQRGIEAPFFMIHEDTKQVVREWSNDDPTGDIPVHYVYCYQDFINPYGIGIVKLAGGTQNTLDYMRQADILATQLGFRPPIKIQGDLDQVDEDSLTYSQDAHWIVGDAEVNREEISNQIYAQLPNRVQMYKISLNQLIPVGDTSIGSGSGDQDYSKTPAGVKFQAASLSIDDDDFRDNLYMTYAAVSKNMINIHFANMQGKDLMRLSDEEREVLETAGIPFPIDATGEPTNQLEMAWDSARATFDFIVDPSVNKEAEDKEKLDGLLRIAELRAADPAVEQALLQSGKKMDLGELFSEIIGLTSDNDKIIVDLTKEDIMRQQQQEQMMMQQQQMEAGQQQLEQESQIAQEQQKQMGPAAKEMQQAEVNMDAVMKEYGVDEGTAAAMLEAERQGMDPKVILAQLGE